MLRLLKDACLGLVLVAAGCSRPSIEVRVQQPIDFSHQAHLAYFSTGQHRNEKIKMHLDIFGMDQPPAELAEGRCVECHDDLADRKPCAGCHVQFQNAALRSQTDVRRCVACHRGAWGGSDATIPSAASCLSCHDAGMRAAHDDTGPRLVLVRDGDPPAKQPIEDVPWIRINTMPPNVYFSHTAHVRFAEMPCTACHQDMRALGSAPSVVRVFSMTDCLTCHVQKGASTDCLTCHK